MSSSATAVRMRLSAIGAIVLLLATLLVTAPAVAQPDPTVERIGDDTDVIGAAIALSERTFDDRGADFVVLGRDDAFPDNLAATALAGTRGPLLYTTGGPDADLDPRVLDEVLRVVAPPDQPCDKSVLAEHGFGVYVVGGPAAVSDDAVQALVEANYCVSRLGGATRYETARLIAQEVVTLNGRDLQVLIARADDWADAATGGAYAAWAGIPVIVTDTDSLHPEAELFIDQLNRRRGTGTGVSPTAYVLGGPAAISFAVEDEVAALIDTQRVAGEARDLTALAIRTQLWHVNASDGLQVVPGYAEQGWAYAFAAAAFAGQVGTPQVYTQPDVLNEASCQAIAEDTLSYVAVVGPTALVSAGVEAQVADAVDGRGCDTGTPMPETLALVVDQYDRVAGDPEPGVWVARTDGNGLRRLATGTYIGTPSWHPDGDRLAVVREAGAHDVVDILYLDGRAPDTFLGPEEMQDGEFIERVAFNPRVTKVDEIAVTIVSPQEDAEPHRLIAIYSPKGGRFSITESGAVSMSAEPYSPDGRLAFVDTGQVVYEDEEFTRHVLADGLPFGEAEWGPSGQIAFDTIEGVAVFEPGANGDPFVLQPYGYARLDWFPPVEGAADRLVYSSTDEGEPFAPTYELDAGAGGAYQGFLPDVSPDGEYVAVAANGEAGRQVVVHPSGFSAITTTVDLPADAFAYPPWYAAAG